MTQSKRPLKVFLCHAHADRDPVRGLYARLTQDGVDAWLDKAKLLPGQDWELEIRKAVREADVVVVCLSKQFNQAGFQQKEVKWALDTAMELPEGEVFIIPVRLEECNVPDSLKRWQWVDLFEDNSYEKLMSSLRLKVYKIIQDINPHELQDEATIAEKTSFIVPPSPYAPEKFINREAEINAVANMLQSQRQRAIVFEGGRGTGKLWLSLHIHRTLFKKWDGITSWLFSLAPVAEGYMPWGEGAQANEYYIQHYARIDVDEFLLEMAKNLPIKLPPNAATEEIVQSIYYYAQGHPNQRYVLILDSVYESDWNLLEQLETFFLGDLYRLNNFFIIITGRGRRYPWKTPYLIESPRVELHRFSWEQIQEQLARLTSFPTFSSRSIYNVGNGLPLLTEFIAYARNQADAVETASLLLFLSVPMQERLHLRRYFEALCLLDSFGETEATLMMETYDPMSEREDGRIICRKMSETHLISWRDGRYFIDRTVQIVLRQYLRLFKLDDWIRLNCVAYRYFQSRKNNLPPGRFHSYFEDQIKIHAEALLEVGSDPENCLNN